MTEPFGDNQEHALRQAVRQFIDDQLRGQEPDIEEFVRQYPESEGRIRQKIQNLRKIDTLFDSLVRVDQDEFEDGAAEQELVGRKIKNFEVVKVIGRGGMGVVYLARDTKLDRSVAVKSIPAKLADDSTARMRFRREARLLASLNHQNVAAIYEIIEQNDESRYLILEYVPGETLAQRIDREPFKVGEALSIAQQIALGLSAAREKGVVHRDLKPGNIRLTPDGRVKVLDFGLAKASPIKNTNPDISSTEPGRIIGTPAYMSPEQARGNPTDHRTDIWSFGCVIFNMLTGQSPFEGETATDTLARIIERQPDWGLLPDDTPEDIRGLLRHCLEKNRDERLGDIAYAAVQIKETLNLLEAGLATPSRTPWPGQTQAAAVSARIESLAVLPLENLTGDPEQEYFADGMTDALIAHLGKIGTITVISRQSVMRYKGSDKPLPEIARELNVQAVVEGTVLCVAEEVRITAQLIEGSTDRHLWVESYKRNLRDVLALQSEVAHAIARQIETTLAANQEVQLAAGRPVNPETYEAYLRGMFHLNKSTPEGFQKGLEYLHQAIERDPADPLAYAGLAAGYNVIGHGPAPSPDALPRARAAAIKALELDGTLAEAHTVLAEVRLYYDWDWASARRALERALELNSNLAPTHAELSWYLQLFGHADRALEEMKRAQELDPLAAIYAAWLGMQYWWTGQDEEAIKQARKSLELDSDFPVGLYVIGAVHATKGMYQEAIAAQQKVGSVAPDWGWSRGHTLALAGQRDKALHVLDELGEEYQQRNPWGVAEVYAALGEKDDAFRWLEAGYECRHNWIPWMGCNPNYEPLHEDPRFGELLRRMNLLQ